MNNNKLYVEYSRKIKKENSKLILKEKSMNLIIPIGIY